MATVGARLSRLTGHVPAKRDSLGLGDDCRPSSTGRPGKRLTPPPPPRLNPAGRRGLTYFLRRWTPGGLRGSIGRCITRTILAKLASVSRRRPPPSRALGSLIVGGLVGAALIGSCGGAGSAPPEGRGGTGVAVVAGFYPLYEVAKRVGGGRVRASNLTPAGVEPHDFELTAGDVDAVSSAHLVLYVGGGFQPALERVLRRGGAEAVDLLDESAAPGGRSDPHVWLDPLSMVAMAQAVEDRLVSLDPAGESVYREGGGRYREELEALHHDFESGLRSCERRLLVTSHSAFAHLAGRYGLEQVALAGRSPEVEPDPRRLAEVADLVRRRGVTTIFYETLASPRAAQALGRETGARARVLDPVEGLSEERLRDGATYVGVMRENLAALVEALGCAGPGTRVAAGTDSAAGSSQGETKPLRRSS